MLNSYTNYPILNYEPRNEFRGITQNTQIQFRQGHFSNWFYQELEPEPRHLVLIALTTNLPKSLIHIHITLCQKHAVIIILLLMHIVRFNFNYTRLQVFISTAKTSKNLDSYSQFLSFAALIRIIKLTPDKIA